MSEENLSDEKCKTCGQPLEKWEKEVCGPCKIADERIAEEFDE